MPIPVVAELRARTSSLFARHRLADTVTLLICFAAASTELAVLAFGAGPLGAYIGLALATAGIVVARYRSWPGLVLIAAGVFVDTFTWQPLVLWTIGVFVVFSVVLKGASAVGTAIFMAASAYVAEVIAEGTGPTNSTAVISVAVTMAAAATASALRSRDRYRQSLQQRALEALAARENEANRAIVEERLRIARDLHDVVGHEIAVVSMQLGVAEVNLSPGDDTARAALHAARTGVQAVLVETQRILGVLRRGAEDDSTMPAPGIAGLSSLVDSFRAIGLTVDADVDPDPPRLDPSVDTAIYRIVQEALTNAQRHGDGHARLSVRASDDVIRLVVVNGRIASSRGDRSRRGYGLVGMRERTSSAGGTLIVRDDPDTFTVEATLRADGGDVS